MAYLTKGIMSRSLGNQLLVLHMVKHMFVDEDGKKYLSASPEMELYLNKYLEELEKRLFRDTNFYLKGFNLL